MHVKTLIVAHAGGDTAGRPNTLQAFEAAVRLGADMIEFDVRRTADGALILHHDETVADRPLAELRRDVALQLAADLGIRVPTLAEVLEAVAGKIAVDVELKEAGYEAQVLDELRRSGVPPEHVIVTSFDAQSLARVKEHSPATRTGWLVYDKSWQQALAEFDQLDAGLLCPDHVMLDDEALKVVANRGISLMPWTVNDPARIRWLLGTPSVVGIITDKTAEALQLRDGAQSEAETPR